MLKESLFQENAVTQIEWNGARRRTAEGKFGNGLGAAGRSWGGRNAGCKRLPVRRIGWYRSGIQVACGGLDLRAMLIHSRLAAHGLGALGASRH